MKRFMTGQLSVNTIAFYSGTPKTTRSYSKEKNARLIFPIKERTVSPLFEKIEKMKGGYPMLPFVKDDSRSVNQISLYKWYRIFFFLFF